MTSVSQYKSYYSEILFSSPEYIEALEIRYEVLRKPLGLEYKKEDLEKEWDFFHLAAFDINGKMIGCLILQPVDVHTLKMRQVAVFPEWQGRSVGTGLVAFSEHFALKKGYTKIELHARISAVEFYNRLHYTKTGNIFKEVGIDHLKMEKTLLQSEKISD